MIYLDSAATSYYRPKAVADAVYQAMMTMGNAGRGSHETSLQSARVIYNTREMLAELFHAPGPEKVAFTSNATEALNIAIQGLTKKGTRMAATAMDHNSVLRPMYRAQKQGCELHILGADEKGNLSLKALEELFQDGIDVFACTHASNLTGNRNDIHEIGRLCRKYEVIFILDVSQTAGIFPIDMQEDCIDILCFTGHKGLMGPQGTGGICLGEGISLPAWKTGGTGVKSYLKEQPQEMPTVLEAGTLNGHGIAGLHAALTYIQKKGMEKIREREQMLMERFYCGVKDLPGVTVYGDFSDKNRAPIVALNLKDYDSAAVSDELAQVYDIQTRAGAHCAPLMHQALHTEQQGAVRFSFSHFLKEDQIDEAVRAVRELTLEESV